MITSGRKKLLMETVGIVVGVISIIVTVISIILTIISICHDAEGNKNKRSNRSAKQ